ncbi:GlsB/YeaQ/YmgE family stress response membrane protein [bacterium]|nr:GlsB/YeaQ/YmgE family stress response membrane protein [bacterium]
MNILYWIIFGFIAGGIANFLTPSPYGGIVGSIVIGILGAILGGYLGNHFFGVGVTGFNVKSFIVAVSGSVLVILISRLLMKR